MLRVTESAKQELKKTLLAHTSDPKLSLRLALRPSGQLGLVPDREKEGDQVVEDDGSKVLLVRPKVAIALDGGTLDVEVTPDGPELVMSTESIKLVVKTDS